VDVFLGPFLDVVRSEVVGPITGVALSSINKFLAYGLIGKPQAPDRPRAHLRAGAARAASAAGASCSASTHTPRGHTAGAPRAGALALAPWLLLRHSRLGMAARTQRALIPRAHRQIRRPLTPQAASKA